MPEGITYDSAGDAQGATTEQLCRVLWFYACSIIPVEQFRSALSFSMCHCVPIEQRITIQRSAMAGIPPEQMQRFRTE